MCAGEFARLCPSDSVLLLEAGERTLAKVAITGGGRCNFTNSFADVSDLKQVYPRGANVMKRALRVFSHEDCRAWFESAGVPSVVQEDQCVFPCSQDAMSVVRALRDFMKRGGVEVRCSSKVQEIVPCGSGFRIDTVSGPFDADTVVVTTGGGAVSMLPSDIALEPLCPSLFTLKIADEGLKSLAGFVADNASVALAGTPFRASGALLVTDWGVSGPATLKLSSYAARHLKDNEYKGTLIINWLGLDEASARDSVAAAAGGSQRLLANCPSRGLSSRAWAHLLHRAGLRADIRCAELGPKGLNKLAACLVADSYPVAGRAHFKEEFVTCGGVSLSEVSLSTLESVRHPGLYFAGEVLDVDAVTGGFNLQAAWSTAMTVARAVAAKQS